MNKRILTIGPAVLAATGALLIAPGVSGADEDKPTARELLDKCDNGTDKCMFRPVRRSTTPGRATRSVRPPTTAPRICSAAP
ncbi:hypothetical protein EV193_101785 [Herbihabitans rhizosphaerae]|uniref:Peptidase inhibitor family I36 n=1 Tax=Herbihabitans rhizosphaerae TaxID=1872711 RepID=A0A4Q7L6H2_9PSEU|nr:hypothetical protein [Herbihabitans rhizosphaerae]RZS44904.1 hypothetical protein EV193_101785 [Herbihabitans rhizosphaerae]